jgi:cytochrome P450 / NADPH-cytochrome P450 reductase
MLHRDPKVWGQDAEEFNPDHFQLETRASLPANAFKPFGSGQQLESPRTDPTVATPSP